MTDERDIGFYSVQGNSPKPNMDYGGHKIVDASTRVIVVADGMGGPGGGDVASKLAVDKAIEIYCDNARKPGLAPIRSAFAAALDAIVKAAAKDPALVDMGTTMVLVGVTDRSIRVGSIGDSRAILFRGDFCRRLTRDHLMIVEQEGIPENQAKGKPRDNILTRALDPDSDGEPDMEEFDILPGDRIVLFSDGVTAHVFEDEMSEIVFNSDPADAAKQIVEMAVGRGSQDHATALVARFGPSNGREARA